MFFMLSVTPDQCQVLILGINSKKSDSDTVRGSNLEKLSRVSLPIDAAGRRYNRCTCFPLPCLSAIVS
jgi:hypothetical protein